MGASGWPQVTAIGSNDEGGMNGNGSYKILLVLITLATIVGGFFTYDLRVDAKIEKEAAIHKELTALNYKAIWTELKQMRTMMEIMLERIGK